MHGNAFKIDGTCRLLEVESLFLDLAHESTLAGPRPMYANAIPTDNGSSEVPHPLREVSFTPSVG